MHVSVYVWGIGVWVCVRHSTYIEVRRQITGIDSLSIVWVSGIEISSSKLMASNISCCVIFLDQETHFYEAESQELPSPRDSMR